MYLFLTSDQSYDPTASFMDEYKLMSFISYINILYFEGTEFGENWFLYLNKYISECTYLYTFLHFMRKTWFYWKLLLAKNAESNT